jgi:hypothetical protein
MNEELNQTKDIEELSDEYSEALDMVPPEVRAFLWSDAFNIILNVISETYKLNNTQKDVVRNIAKETLIGVLTPVSRRTMLADVGIIGELQENILNAINDEIISRAIVQVENYNELHNNKDSELGTDIEVLRAPTPTQALANIQERLSQPKIVTPSKRDYSVEKINTPTQETLKAPSIDPYRELPSE